jgi:uncharacterized membrane protein
MLGFKVIKFITRWKLRLQYAGSYISIVGMPLLLVDLLQEKLQAVGVVIPYIVLFGIAAATMLIAGWLFDVFGVWEAENDYGYEKQGKLRSEVRARRE